MGIAPDNEKIGATLTRVADVLREQDADRFRVEAWRRGAEAIRHLDEPVRAIYEREGLAGLNRIPSIGPVIARAIQSLLATGHLPMLERLRGESHPASLLATVAGVGPKFAERIEGDLGIHTLEELEVAAHDGRLASVPGFGLKRIRSVVDALAGRLGRIRGPASDSPEPPTTELLDVDREYRERADAGALRRITPRRFNPAHEAWLPVLHTTRGGRHYTALFSNTAQAHRFGRTHDWVVIYSDGADGERQYTAVTATRGPCAGYRIVRGRDAECGRDAGPEK